MKHPHVGTVATVTCAMAVAGCSSIFGSSDNPRIGLRYELERAIGAQSELHVRVTGREVRLPAPVPGLASGSSAEIFARRYGDLPIEVVLLTSSGDTLAAADLTVPVRRNYDHAVWTLVGQSQPAGFCMGPPLAVPIRGAATDTMFVMYSSVPRDAVC